MNKIKNFFLYILNRKKNWLPSVIVIVIIFIILMIVGKFNPILFLYS